MINPKINLLPYREAAKKAAKIRYLSFIGVACVAGALTLGGIHSFYAMQVASQEARNAMLEQEIATLDKQIEMIQKLRTEIAAAVARKQVVESLQANRNRAVMILNQIVQPPANVFYKSVKQSGDTIFLSGYAPSNTSVSALIKQFESSDVFFEPKLVESKATVLESTPLIEFSMNAKLVNLAQAVKDKDKSKKPTPTAKVASAPGNPDIIAAPTAPIVTPPAASAPAASTPAAAAPPSKAPASQPAPAAEPTPSAIKPVAAAK